MQLKIHRSYSTVVAICDSELIGKNFVEGNLQLDVRENFYKDQEVSESELLDIIKKQSLEDATFNIVGEKSVKTALKAEIITKKSIGRIQKIPFALVLL